MLNIKVTHADADGEQGYYMADSSDLGLRPGQWPEVLETDLGDGTPFVRAEQQHYATDDALEYVQRSTQTVLVIFND